MTYNPQKHHRQSIRLKGYDYSQAGLYFITICCQDRACLFGEIVGANNYSPKNEMDVSPENEMDMYHSPKMELNDAGKIASQCWLDIPKHFPNVILHEFIIMPNHIHGIVELVGANNHSPENGMDVHHSPENIMDVSPDNEMDVSNGNGAKINGAKNFSPLRSPSKTIGSVVRGYKIGVTKWFRANINFQPPRIWQRNYYEHIIRNEQSYQTISNYIIDNPAKWNDDKFYTAQ